MNYYKYTLFFLIIIILGCATYYKKNLRFQEHFARGEIEEANELLEKDTKSQKGKNKLLYYLNRGVLYRMLGNFEESNTYFSKADLTVEDFQKNYGKIVLSTITNPMVLPYKGEDFEIVLINYYMALNYLLLNEFEEAMVEVKRINIKLNQLNDKYKKKNRYKRDAFAHNLMGIIYDASGDYNNAFIAYRNSLEAYQEDYASFFGLGPPEQLKKDLLKTAYMIGFRQELEQYEKEFSMKYQPSEHDGGELVFFWHNGLGPVKAEWSINFVIVPGAGGIVSFVNEEEDLTFPFLLSGNNTDEQKSQLTDLKAIRVAFPKYVQRKPFYNSAHIKAGEKKYPLELAQPINNIAFKTLEDRMLRELSNVLLRLAIKQAVEYAARQENEGFGALVSVVNALTEKADTRNWQTLPHSISYTRIPLPSGEHQIELRTLSTTGNIERTYNIKVNIHKGRTSFYTFHNLESLPE